MVVQCQPVLTWPLGNYRHFCITRSAVWTHVADTKKKNTNGTEAFVVNLWTWIKIIYIYIYIYIWGRRVIGISGSLIRSRTLMELIFNPYCEFRWSPEGPVSQIHSAHLNVGAPGIFSDILCVVHMLKCEWDAESNSNLPQLFNPW